MCGLSQEGRSVTRSYFAKSHSTRCAEGRKQREFDPNYPAISLGIGIAPSVTELRMILGSLRRGIGVIMKILKIMTMAGILGAFFAAVLIVSAASRTAGGDQFDAATASANQSDAAGTYKAKCIACHGQKAEKKFDSSLPDQQLIDAVLKGKKLEKPPNMPAYADKGVSAEQAKALIEHMKQLKIAP